MAWLKQLCSAMFSLEVDEVDPLYRAPLSLAIVAAAVKYVTTAWVLDDPLLKTVAEVRKEREAPPSPEAHSTGTSDIHKPI